MFRVLLGKSRTEVGVGVGVCKRYFSLTKRDVHSVCSLANRCFALNEVGLRICIELYMRPAYETNFLLCAQGE